jgi:hypothetical protein
MWFLRLGLLLAIAWAAAARDRIALIEFFGYQGLDVDVIRAGSPVREGASYSDTAKCQVREAVRSVTGRDATDVQGVCCDAHGDFTLFVGLPGESSRVFRLNPNPAGTVRLSKPIVDLFAKLDRAEQAAVRKGGEAAREDASSGYRLLKYPPARRLELQVRQYALAHEAELEEVLGNCSHGEQRSIAADALGYAERSPWQLAALVRACRDPNDEVRNNATRALGEMASADPALASQIPAADFVEMVWSGAWTARNKAAFLLGALTNSRDPQLLALIRSQAWKPLPEMARWRDTGHAATPRIILGRIRGVPEEQLMRLAFGTPQEFLNALGLE